MFDITKFNLQEAILFTIQAHRLEGKSNYDHLVDLFTARRNAGVSESEINEAIKRVYAETEKMDLYQWELLSKFYQDSSLEHQLKKSIVEFLLTIKDDPSIAQYDELQGIIDQFAAEGMKTEKLKEVLKNLADHIIVATTFQWDIFIGTVKKFVPDVLPVMSEHKKQIMEDLLSFLKEAERLSLDEVIDDLVKHVWSYKDQGIAHADVLEVNIFLLRKISDKPEILYYLNKYLTRFCPFDDEIIW